MTMKFRIIVMLLTLVFAGCSVSNPGGDKLVLSEVCSLDEEYYEAQQIAPEDRMHFAKDKNTLFVGGILDVSLLCHISYIFDQDPRIDTIVLSNVADVVDLNQVRKAALFVRSKGINTVLSRGGSVAGGGLDFFMAGKERHLADTEDFEIVFEFANPNLINLPMNHPDHLEHLDFYAKLGFNPGFYWDMIDLGSPEQTLSLEQLNRYEIISQDQE